MDEDEAIIAALADALAELGVDDIVDPQAIVDALREGGFSIVTTVKNRTAHHA